MEIYRHPITGAHSTLKKRIENKKTQHHGGNTLPSNNMVDWHTFAKDSVLHETGFMPFVLEIIWLTYCGFGTSKKNIFFL